MALKGRGELPVALEMNSTVFAWLVFVSVVLSTTPPPPSPPPRAPHVTGWKVPRPALRVAKMILRPDGLPESRECREARERLHWSAMPCGPAESWHDRG